MPDFYFYDQQKDVLYNPDMVVSVSFNENQPGQWRYRLHLTTGEVVRSNSIFPDHKTAYDKIVADLMIRGITLI